MNFGKKLLIGFGTLAVLSLIIGFAVSNASAKAEVKAREIDQAHRQTIKDAEVVQLKVKQAGPCGVVEPSLESLSVDAVLKVKQAERDKVIADAKPKADLNTVPATGSLFDLSGTEEARITNANRNKAVQDAIANQKKATSSNSTLTSPMFTTPTLVTPTPVTSGVMESNINSNFDGWTGDTIFQLRNGQIWQQSSYDYKYHYAYSPSVEIYQSGSGYKMKVDGVDSAISVTRIK